MRRLYFYYSFSLLFFFFTSCKSDNAIRGLHPMVDGRNSEYDQLGIEPIVLLDSVNLYFFQNDAYVWISYDYPAGSYGGADVIIKTETVTNPLNLHISAQLGEWPVDDESKKPQYSESPLWWEIEGWTANPLWANGIDTVSYDEPTFNIKNGEMREIQLAKARFGTGEWKIKLNIYAIKNQDGVFTSIEFPKNDAYHTLLVD